MIEWEQKDTWVGVFDILGFKNLIQLADQEFQRVHLTSKLDDLFETLESDAVQSGQLECIVISDTIVIFAPDLDIRSYGWFLLQCEIIMEKSISVRLPLRGAISVGTAFVYKSPHRNMMIGPSFLEAYKYCEAQSWIGLLMTPSATLAVREAGLDPLHHDFVLDDIPWGEKLVETENVLAHRLQNGMSRRESPLLKSLRGMRHSAPEKDKAKYDATMAFIEKHNKFKVT